MKIYDNGGKTADRYILVYDGSVFTMSDDALMPNGVNMYLCEESEFYLGEDDKEGNLPNWKGASSVYSKAYKYMKEHGADQLLIEALASGDEERIKANMLRINAKLFLKD